MNYAAQPLPVELAAAIALLRAHEMHRAANRLELSGKKKTKRPRTFKAHLPNGAKVALDAERVAELQESKGE